MWTQHLPGFAGVAVWQLFSTLAGGPLELVSLQANNAESFLRRTLLTSVDGNDKIRMTVGLSIGWVGGEQDFLVSGGPRRGVFVVDARGRSRPGSQAAWSDHIRSTHCV